MCDIRRLEDYRRISEAGRDLAKKRSEILEKELLIKNGHAGDEVTVESHNAVLSKWNGLLKLILEKKEEVECLLADSGSLGNCDIPPNVLKKIIESLADMTTKLEIVRSHMTVKDLSNLKISRSELDDAVNQEMRNNYKKFSMLTKFVEGLI